MSNFCYSQLTRFRSILFSSKFTTYQDVWTDWTPWQSSGVLITLNKETQRIVIYSETHQSYDIIEKISENYDEDGNPIFKVKCLDENGTKCLMTWYKRKDDGDYVRFSFSNLELMYKVVLITD